LQLASLLYSFSFRFYPGLDHAIPPAHHAIKTVFYARAVQDGFAARGLRSIMMNQKLFEIEVLIRKVPDIEIL
jgi:hypothetical protein